MKGYGETILLADDDAKVLELVSTVLQRLGYKVIPASNGKEALGLYDEHKEAIDLLMLDILMPEMSGTSVAIRIRETNPDIPLLFVTAYSDDITDGEMEKLNKYGVIRKPMQMANLGEMVRCFLE